MCCSRSISSALPTLTEPEHSTEAVSVYLHCIANSVAVLILVILRCVKRIADYSSYHSLSPVASHLSWKILSSFPTLDAQAFHFRAACIHVQYVMWSGSLIKCQETALELSWFFLSSAAISASILKSTWLMLLPLTFRGNGGLSWSTVETEKKNRMSSGETL